MIKWKRIEKKTRTGFGGEESIRFWEEWDRVCAICAVEGKQVEGHRGRATVIGDNRQQTRRTRG